MWSVEQFFFNVFGCLLLIIPASRAGVGWEYAGSLGPDKWHEEYADCKGRMQSPINVMPTDMLYDPKLQAFDLSQFTYCRDCQMSLHNVKGHTAEVKYKKGPNPITIKGGSLPDKYVLDQFHFHWGSENARGSEHFLGGKPAPMEMHIVHHADAYEDRNNSMAHPYGLAVLGYFFKIGEHNKGFEKLLSNFDKIVHSGNFTDIETFNLQDLLPATQGPYYRYFGSLTTPPCYESVIWSLFKDPIEISQKQIETFRSLKRVSADGTREVPLTDDFRPLQDLHERNIITNDASLAVLCATGTASASAADVIVLMTSLLVAVTSLVGRR